MNPESDGRQSALRVLVVEDYDVYASVLEWVLIGAGCEVECVADAPAALGRAAVGCYDAVVTDHDLGSSSGIDVSKGLKALGFSGRVVLHSTPFSSATAAEYLAIGIDEIVYKPCVGDVLLRALFPTWKGK